MHILPLHSHFCNAKTCPKMAFISTYIYLFCRIVTLSCFAYKKKSFFQLSVVALTAGD